MLSRWLAVADEAMRAVKFVGAVVVLCVGEAWVAMGPYTHTVEAWAALGILVAAQVALVSLYMLRWPPN